MQQSRIDPVWIAVAEIIARIEDEQYHWPVGRVSLQKIVYFATELGLPTGLRYKRGSFGPFGPRVKRELTKLTNNSILKEERLGRMFAARVGPTFHDARKVYADRLLGWSDLIDRITDLFLRMRTAQAEMAATVHFVAKELATKRGSEPSEMDVLRAVLEWKKKHRPPLVESEVAQTIRSLNVSGWIKAAPSQDLPVEVDPALADES